ncbi:MAG: potassium transporter Kup [Gammaproteobacteria bacterium]|nr:potassium transporter Kup [Gammaproteobacteria bacterium]
MTASAPAHGTATPKLALAALGVVFGDIGTSPLYAFREAFAGAHGLAVDEASVLAVLSALFWAVTLVISIKYVAIVLRFDNQGEGGVLALTALAHRLATGSGRASGVVIIGGVFAAALFYGDAIITPAISVLSAIEGTLTVAPNATHLVVPVTVVILILLFVFQSQGTDRVGRLFGPITLLWFTSLALLGASSIIETPAVLAALHPGHALRFIAGEPHKAVVLLSAVFLALTGGEALYADMGHFGARPVRLAWYGLVCPALLINYFGQGALVLRDAAAVANPFYRLAPEAAVLPMVLLATAATVIASQATITGAYSMTLQATRLGFLPRVRILHTSDTERGQIYVPAVNWLMLLAVVWLVFAFKSSGALAAAYGIAVSGTMIITTVLAFYVRRITGGRSRALLLCLLVMFALLETLFLGANLLKIGDGGWLPLALGALLFLLLTTWKEGSSRVSAQRRRIDIPMQDFLRDAAPDVPTVAGTAVYLTSDPQLVPSALFHNLKHFKVMHERTVFLNVVNEEIPWMSNAQRVQVVQLKDNVYAVAARFGFREEPDVPSALSLAAAQGLVTEPMDTTYFIARSLIVDGPGELPRWRCALFSWMTRQSESAASYFRLPANRVVELGTQVML